MPGCRSLWRCWGVRLRRWTHVARPGQGSSSVLVGTPLLLTLVDLPYKDMPGHSAWNVPLATALRSSNLQAQEGFTYKRAKTANRKTAHKCFLVFWMSEMIQVGFRDLLLVY